MSKLMKESEKCSIKLLWFLCIVYSMDISKKLFPILARKSCSGSKLVLRKILGHFAIDTTQYTIPLKD
jgi:hypothetical protein